MQTRKAGERPGLAASRRTRGGAAKTALAVLILAGTGGLPCGCAPGARSSPAHGGPIHGTTAGWQTYKDSHLGFAVERPAGWSVQADAHSILVQSPDHAEIVWMEAFSAPDGEVAEAHLDRLPADRAALFPQARVEGVAAQPSKGDEFAASLSYQTARGPGQGRVLCSIIHGKGLLFALAAPGGRFPADQSTLTRVLKSLRFLAPAAASAGHGATAVLPRLHYVPWTDPREHAFHVEIPQGWKADGGAFRFGPTDVRIAYQVMSPAKDMTVLVGDPRLPSGFQAPNALTEQTGMRDGTNGLLHYMPAVEFNRWYLDAVGRQVLDDMKLGEDHPLDEVSRRRTAMAQQAVIGAAQTEVSVGITEFSGRSKETGKPVTGIVLGTTQRTTRAGVNGLESTFWFGSPMVLVCVDDAGKARSQQTVLAVLGHLLQTYREDPAWDSRRAREIAQATGQALQRTAQRSQQIAKSSDDARAASMGAYWGHVQADDERQRGFINYLADRTDVTNGAGTSYNVQSGSKNYYQNDRTGVIVGTDSEYSPGVDFTPLTER